MILLINTNDLFFHPESQLERRQFKTKDYLECAKYISQRPFSSNLSAIPLGEKWRIVKKRVVQFGITIFEWELITSNQD